MPGSQGSHGAAAPGFGKDATGSPAQPMALDRRGCRCCSMLAPELHPCARRSGMGAAHPALGEAEGCARMWA